MEIANCIYTKDGWEKHPDSLAFNPDLAIIFGSIQILPENGFLEDLNNLFPDAIVTGCTTAGEIQGGKFIQDKVIVNCIAFKDTHIEAVSVEKEPEGDSLKAGRELAEKIPAKGLRHCILLSEGIHINGSELVSGITDSLPGEVEITGGLASDNDEFNETLVLLNEEISSNKIVLLGFYGDSLQIGHGFWGGWDPFGPDRLITKSEGSKLFELDEEPALEIYKKYLGPYSKDLPASGLLFPLYVYNPETDVGYVRTILGVDEDEKSITFAGNITEGLYARLMKANHHRVVEAAYQAAKNTIKNNGARKPDFALVFSCIGRKFMLKQRTEEELEAVQEYFGNGTYCFGMYSNGEIAPDLETSASLLHNQTLCITTFTEK